MPTAEFWKSEDSRGYPYGVNCDGEYLPMFNDDRRRQIIGETILNIHFIPPTGDILDLGASKCSDLYFGKETVLSRVTAVDGSAVQLVDSQVPENRRFVMDLGSEFFPEDWNNRFSLATSFLLSRYLSDQEKAHLAKQVRKVLKPGSKYLIVDIDRLASAKLARIMGEVAEMDLNQEEVILFQAGFNSIFSFPVINSDQNSGFTFNIVYGIK